MMSFEMSSGFVSSSELSEEKKQRQLEWEKVRKAEDPFDAPEPEVCNKSLFEQLKINKDKKDLEFQEERALKNLVRGIDEDESHFLSMVDQGEEERRRKKKAEEADLIAEMAEVRGRISIDVPATTSRVNGTVKTVKEGVKSRQAQMIGSLIKRKSTVEGTVEGETEEKKTKKDDEDDHKREEGNAKTEQPGKGLIGLVDYGSDSNEDED